MRHTAPSTCHATPLATCAALATTTIDSPVGPLAITASTRGVRSICFDAPAPAADPAAAASALAIARAAAAQLAEYFTGGRRAFDLPLDAIGTPFQQSAWAALRTIPYGQTRSYLDQARALGDANACRAVGAANGRNPIAIIVPCHRVIGADGSLTGFGGGVERKRWLLDFEQRALISIAGGAGASLLPWA